SRFHHISPFFLLHHRRTPTSTLFPYTTLSDLELEAPQHVDEVVAEEPRAVAAGQGAEVVEIEIAEAEVIEIVDCRLQPRGDGIADRKSSRLNSSHLVISYAVFCLKKKKIKTI